MECLDLGHFSLPTAVLSDRFTGLLASSVSERVKCYVIVVNEELARKVFNCTLQLI